MDQQNNGFFITLPSNSNVNLYPNNQPANFKVKLPQPINLAGKWEVALYEVTYPHNWHDIIHGGFVAFSTIPSTKDVQIDKIEEVDRLQSKSTQKLLQCTGEDKVECWRDTTSTGDILLWVAPGHYGSPANLIKEVNERMAASALRKGYKQPPVELTYHSPSNELFVFNKGYFKVESNKDNREELAKVFGLKRRPGHMTISLDDNNHELKQADLYETPLTGLGCRFYFSPPSIYMYSDVVEHNIVGDKLVQLLRTVPITGNHGEIVHNSFDNLIYRPVAKEYLSEIEVQLSADTGELMPFNGGEVIVVLHFKPAIL